MARTGISVEEVRQARDAVLLAGGHPSIDAVRAQLGHTGSKTTISRHLKALEAEDNRGLRSAKSISDALQELVAGLGERLHQEAAAHLAQAKERLEEPLRQRDAALNQLRQENAQHSAQMQRLQTELQAERLAHDDTRTQLLATTAENARYAQRIADLQRQIGEHDQLVQSLQEQHTHAREVLEHFRQSAKEQREQEQRRHEHQVQQLQLEQRTLEQTLVVKQHELTTTQQAHDRLIGEKAVIEQFLQQFTLAQKQWDEERDRSRKQVAQHEAAAMQSTQQLQLLEQDVMRWRHAAEESEKMARQHELTIAQLQTKLVIQAQLLHSRDASPAT